MADASTMVTEMLKKTQSPQPADMLVGARIRHRRDEMHMSQMKLGEQLGVTFQQVQKYEKGTNRVSASRLNTMAQALGCDVAYFFQDVAGGQPVEALQRDAILAQEAFNKIRCPKVRANALAVLVALAAGGEAQP